MIYAQISEGRYIFKNPCAQAGSTFLQHCSGRTVLHLTDNVNVHQIIKKGSNQRALAETSRRIFLACRRRKIVLIVNWESREAEVRKEVDAGSCGPWLLQDEFQLDFDTYSLIMTRLSLLKSLFKNRFYIFIAD